MLFAVLLAFVGCGDTIADTTPADTTPADTTPADTPPDSAHQSKEFVVSGEKHTYKNKDVLLLNVKNQTDKDYDVTAVVHYFDAEGNEVKSQKQTFAGWASGYQNYFLFQPDITFDTFAYTLELEEFKGEECYTKDVTATFEGLREDFARPVKYPLIYADFRVENRSGKALFIAGKRIVFDKYGNIYYMNEFSESLVSGYENFNRLKVYSDETAEELIWPDELTGDVSGVYIITRVWQ